MRRLQIVLAIALLAVAHSLAHGQGIMAIKGGLSYGVAANGGLSPGSTRRSGFALGLGVATGGPVGFGVEAMYAQRGYTSVIAADSRRLDYFDVPVTLRLTASGEQVSPFAYAGPQLSIEIQCDAGSNNCPDSGRKKTTFAGIIGAGLRFPALGGLSLEGRYVYGLTDLNLSTVSTAESYKSRSLLLLLGKSF